MARVPTLLLTGTIGSGKTVVAAEVGALLAERGTPVALIDLDWLNWVHLGPAFTRYDDLLIRNLTAVWPNFLAAGARSFVLVRAVEKQATIDAIRAALPDADLAVVRLVASPSAIAERLRRRDAGATLAEHLAEAERFTRTMDEASLEGAVVSNDGRAVRAVAGDVLAAWEGA
jgi:adenylylsulfate kinase